MTPIKWLIHYKKYDVGAVFCGFYGTLVRQPNVYETLGELGRGWTRLVTEKAF